MRKLIFASMLFASTLSACAGNSKENTKETKKENNQLNEVKKMGTIHLTKAELISTLKPLSSLRWCQRFRTLYRFSQNRLHKPILC